MERLVDLHVHLDGSLSLETVKELAARQGIEIQSDNILIKTSGLRFAVIY